MRYFFLIFFCFYSFSSFSQGAKQNEENGKWGVFDYQLEDWLIQPTYDSIQRNWARNKTGFFIVKKKKKWGVINLKNEVIIPIKNLGIGFLKEAFFKVNKNRKKGWRLYDLKGNLVRPDFYATINPLVPHGSRGKRPLEFIVVAKRNQGKGLLDEKGEIILPCQFDRISTQLYSYSKKGIPTLFPVSKNFKWGFAKKGGEVVIPFKFDHVNPFEYQVAVIRKGKYSFLINENGEFLTQKKYNGIRRFHLDQTAIVELDGKLGMINKQGKELISPIYEELRRKDDIDDRQIDSKLFYVKKDGLYGIIDIRNNPLSPFNEKGHYLNFDKGAFSNSEGMFNIKGEKIEFDSIDSVEPFYGKFFLTKRNEKSGVTNLATNEIIVPHIYDEIQHVKYTCGFDFLFVKKDGKSGLITTQNEVIIPIEYYNIQVFPRAKIILVRKNKKGALANFDGEFLTDFEFDRFPRNRSFSFPYYTTPIALNKNDKWGFVNEKGETVIPFVYEKAWDFKSYLHGIPVYSDNCLIPYTGVETYGRVRINDQLEWIDKNGEISDSLDMIRNKINDNLFKFKEKDGRLFGIKNKNGKVIFPIQFNLVKVERNGFVMITKNSSHHGYYIPSVEKTFFFDRVIMGYLDDATIRWGKKGGAVGFIRNNGEEKMIYENVAKNYSENLIAVSKNGKVGFIDKNGEVIIPFKFDIDASHRLPFKFSKGFGLVYLNKKYGFINKKGQTIIPFEYDAISSFDDGQAAGLKNGKWVEIIFPK